MIELAIVNRDRKRRIARVTYLNLRGRGRTGLSHGISAMHLGGCRVRFYCC